uniref:PAT complex subunit CCDC47 n=2 Tax=Onchocerca TaxID=6281 RepID=A0A8R1U089_ONCVO
MMWPSLTNGLFTIWIIIISQLLRFSNAAAEMDNEFAEFEDMEVEDVNDQDAILKPYKEADKLIADKLTDDSDDDEFIDEDEFSKPIKKTHLQKTEPEISPQLRFADVPAHFRSNWASYQVEALVLVILAVYMLNYIFGRTRNRNIANKWFMDVTPLLEEQFTLVGDDGTSVDLKEGHMHKETDAVYTIWCSGRIGCQGMLITLKLLKRQDLIHVVMNLIRPKQDKIIIRIDVDNNEMDSFVFAIGQRKSVTKAVKEKMDLSFFTVERKGVDRLGLPSSIVIYAEIFEAVNAIIDPAVLSVFRKYENAIDYFHFSDQYSGYKPSDGESFTRLPETSRVLFFVFKMSNDMAEIDALLRMVFHCFEKIRRYRLSREGKLKADKKRQSVQEVFLKTTHQARQEAAQARREEKTRERKQRLLEEEDPEKQRRLEKLEQKRDMKMRQPKMKQLKVK